MYVCSFVCVCVSKGSEVKKSLIWVSDRHEWVVKEEGEEDKGEEEEGPVNLMSRLPPPTLHFLRYTACCGDVGA